MFLGAVPRCFGNTSLRKLDFSSNKLISRIPSSLWSLKDILVLDISSSALSGMISPELLWSLHHNSLTLVVHCDVKLSNVLLDEDIAAHLSDFGIAKLFEYGSKGVVSIKGDMYGYGILLMEIFTRKKPTDEMFVQGLSLKDRIKVALGSGGRWCDGSDRGSVNEGHMGVLTVRV
ncbi:putative receptor-like protein kinase At3g47110 [Prosopis cineraria]|uniref:putative receptor-like protein kinase At3g47110 n=1 Tax=Prosopis cineraria TaxID=364024 RepID=UPI00240EE901|nr:putative receptor-like protein kinase At3g47110 [Prosopis cineraria]